MKFLFALAAFIGVTAATSSTTCTEQMQIACVDDFRAAYPVCKKAADAGGSDMIADLACMKYYNKMKGECWPCICFVAEQEKVKIKGC